MSYGNLQRSFDFPETDTFSGSASEGVFQASVSSFLNPFGLFDSWIMNYAYSSVLAAAQAEGITPLHMDIYEDASWAKRVYTIVFTAHGASPVTGPILAAIIRTALGGVIALAVGFVLQRLTNLWWGPVTTTTGPDGSTTTGPSGGGKPFGLNLGGIGLLVLAVFALQAFKPRSKPT